VCGFALVNTVMTLGLRESEEFLGPSGNLRWKTAMNV
jgi:hypothetical protein